jgi:hypothetical protein
MMKTVDIILNRPGTAARVYQLAFKDPCRVIAAHVTAEVAQTGAATVTLGKNGAATTILSKDLDGLGAATAIDLAWTGSLTEANRKQIFDKDTPLELSVNLNEDSTLHLQLVLDPFLIGAHKGLATS